MSPAKKKVGAGGVLRGVKEGEVVAGEDGNKEALGGEGSVGKAREEDPRRMLENLRETVEGLKRRRESVLADAGLSVPTAESDAEEGRVDFQAKTTNDGNKDKEKERPRARMLRGRAREVGVLLFSAFTAFRGGMLIGVFRNPQARWRRANLRYALLPSPAALKMELTARVDRENEEDYPWQKQRAAE
jgi:hypothetical protein